MRCIHFYFIYNQKDEAHHRSSNSARGARSLPIHHLIFAPLEKGSVAQLDRAPDYGSGGLGFESLQGHEKSLVTEGDRAFSFLRNLSLLK